jgi:hypothetical protein
MKPKRLEARLNSWMEGGREENVERKRKQERKERGRIRNAYLTQ